MTGSGTDPGPERLAVVAELIDGSHDDTVMATATAGELDLADAICGQSMPDADAGAIAGLLRIADGKSPAPLLRIGLRETFLDGKPGDRAAAFAGTFRRLALPGLDGDAGKQAEAILGSIARARA